MRRDTQVLRDALALTSPPVRPSTHGESCPSSHRFGAMNDRFGVVFGSGTAAGGVGPDRTRADSRRPTPVPAPDVASMSRTGRRVLHPGATPAPLLPNSSARFARLKPAGRRVPGDGSHPRPPITPASPRRRRAGPAPPRRGAGPVGRRRGLGGRVHGSRRGDGRRAGRQLGGEHEHERRLELVDRQRVDVGCVDVIDEPALLERVGQPGVELRRRRPSRPAMRADHPRRAGAAVAGPEGMT